MAAKPPSTRRKPRGKPPAAASPLRDLTDADLLSLEAMAARPLDPAAHDDACAKLACELIRRVLVRTADD